MKRNGFTLVELLAVIFVLGLILTLTVTSVLNSGDKVKSNLSNQQKRNIEDAAKLLAIDLDDYTSDIYNCNTSSWMNGKCQDTTSPADNIWDIANISLEDLKTNDYFQDTSGHCSGSGDDDIIITKENGAYEITLSTEIECD